jgi:hypothetical protein
MRWTALPQTTPKRSHYGPAGRRRWVSSSGSASWSAGATLIRVILGVHVGDLRRAGRMQAMIAA